MKIAPILIGLVSIVFIVSCSSSPIKRDNSEDLSETVSKFYEMKKAGQFDEAWNLERMSTDENEERRENSRRIYISRSAGGMQLKDYEILEIGEEGSGIEGLTPVKIKLITEWPALSFPTPEGDRIIVMEDLWEKIDRKWYHVVRGMTKLW